MSPLRSWCRRLNGSNQIWTASSRCRARAPEPASSRGDGLSSTLELPTVRGGRQGWLVPPAWCLYIGVYPGERQGSLHRLRVGDRSWLLFVPTMKTSVQKVCSLLMSNLIGHQGWFSLCKIEILMGIYCKWWGGLAILLFILWISIVTNREVIYQTQAHFCWV